MSTERSYQFPAFDELPTIPGAPPGSIWGIYDAGDKKDEVGGKALQPQEHVTEHI